MSDVEDDNPEGDSAMDVASATRTLREVNQDLKRVELDLEKVEDALRRRTAKTTTETHLLSGNDYKANLNGCSAKRMCCWKNAKGYPCNSTSRPRQVRPPLTHTQLVSHHHLH